MPTGCVAAGKMAPKAVRGWEQYVVWLARSHYSFWCVRMFLLNLALKRERKLRLSLASLCSQCVRSRSKEVLTGRYRNNCWWMRAHSCFMSVNITYQRMLSACFVVLYKLSLLFWHNFLLCKHFTNCDMKQPVLPTAPVLWCLAAHSHSRFSSLFLFVLHKIAYYGP